MLRKMIVSTVALVGLTGLASAADMYVKAPPPVYVSSWTGCYIGGHAGYGREQSTSSAADFYNYEGYYFYADTKSNEFNNSGFAGGGQAGCQLQTGNFLWGLEGDWSSFSNSSSKTWGTSSTYDSNYYYGSNSYNETISKSSLWSVRARFGIITSEVYHLYATFGIGGEKASAALSGTYTSGDTTGNYCSPSEAGYYCGSGAVSASKDSTGLVLGVGAEWKIWSNVVVGAEYLHYALASDVSLPGTTCASGYYCGGKSYNLAIRDGSTVHFGDADVIRFRASWLFNMGR